MGEFTFAMYFNAVAAFVIAELTALLSLRYPNQNLFHILPTTMVALVSTTILYYLFLIGILVFPSSRFATTAKHLMVFFAYAAVSSLVAALFPDRRATTSIYTIFVLLVVGHALFVLGVFAVEDEDRIRVNKDEVQADQTWYEGFATACRRYKKILARGVAAFFQEQTTQPANPSLPR